MKSARRELTTRQERVINLVYSNRVDYTL